jgi:hypothetical protein
MYLNFAPQVNCSDFRTMELAAAECCSTKLTEASAAGVINPSATCGSQICFVLRSCIFVVLYHSSVMENQVLLKLNIYF